MQTILADAIQNRLSDPRIPAITSITRVEVSEDMSVARVFVSVMEREAQRSLCLTALRSAARRLRRMVGDEVRLRRVPVLDFRLDDALRQSIVTIEAIDRAMEELGERPEWGSEESDESEQAPSLTDEEASADGSVPARERTDEEPDDEAKRDEQEGV